MCLKSEWGFIYATKISVSFLFIKNNARKDMYFLKKILFRRLTIYKPPKMHLFYLLVRTFCHDFHICSLKISSTSSFWIISLLQRFIYCNSINVIGLQQMPKSPISVQNYNMYRIKVKETNKFVGIEVWVSSEVQEIFYHHHQVSPWKKKIVLFFFFAFTYPLGNKTESKVTIFM